MQLIPLTNDPRQFLTVALDRQTVDVHVYWQPLSKAWYVQLNARAGEVLAAGRQMAPNQRLLGRVQGFAGELAAVPIGIDKENLGRHPWGETHRLVYLTAAEAAQAGWTN